MDADVTNGKYSINLKDFFKSQLSTVDKVLLVSTPKREFKVIEDLSKQVNKTVAFEQIVSIDANNAYLNFTFKNFKRMEASLASSSPKSVS